MGFDVVITTYVLLNVLLTFIVRVLSCAFKDCIWVFVDGFFFTREHEMFAGSKNYFVLLDPSSQIGRHSSYCFIVMMERMFRLVNRTKRHLCPQTTKCHLVLMGTLLCITQ